MSEELTAEEKADAQLIFEGKVTDRTACQYCAGLHDRVAGLLQQYQPCPRIKRIEWHVDGTPLNVEFWRPGTWEHNVIFPADVYGDDNDA